MESVIGKNTIGYSELLITIRDGILQNKLASWYTSLIEDNVMEYLVKEGYDPHAVSKDYINQKPKDVARIEQNNDLLTSLLKQENEQLLYEQLIRPLTKKIYPVVNDIILVFQMNIIYHYHNKFHPHKLLLNQDFLGDYLYLVSLLDETKVRGKKADVDVVTFVGLIYGFLIRLSCECQTCMTHWNRSV
ncbi:Uncharacterized protein QTN25_005708 [Entamoeba marina]